MFPVHVFRIQLDLCHFPDDMVHVSGFLGCNTCVARLGTIAQVYAVFCNS
jgi:hypothetical protein